MPLRSLTIASALLLACASVARADEGMWTLDQFPSAKVMQTYGVAPSTQFLTHVQRAALRIAGGCSASFISPHGLVMTNHHCVAECVGQLSTGQQDFVQSGFYAKRTEDEKPCPAFELDQLLQIEDITAKIQGAVSGKSGDAANVALRAAEAAAQKSCGNDPATRCDVVPLYHGGVYDLYHYHRYTDVRLAFAPEFAVAQFGGDSDNFNFPRFDFDIGIVRAYEHGKPATTPDYFKWSANGSTARDLVFVVGNPGGTSRELTNAQLAFVRDVDLPSTLPRLAELRGILEEFQRRGSEPQREANEDRFFIENALKARLGRQRALNDPGFFGQKVAEERKLRDAVSANRGLQATAGSSWAEIAKLQALRAELEPRYQTVENGFRRGLLGYARTLVRAAAERRKPNGKRLPEFTDQSLVEVEQELSAPVPVYPDLEEVLLGFTLTKLRETLGTDDPLVKTFLGAEAPDALAHRLVAGTKLGNPAVRKALFLGGAAAIAASTDPMIAYAKLVDPDARRIRKNYETRITAPSRAAAQRIAKARFAVYGRSVDPDATFTLRLSYGAVQGFNANGTQVPPYTTIGGLFKRATGATPYALPRSWLVARTSLDPAVPMNLSTTNDIIGGNSGSPLLDKAGDVVGLIFDGNIYSLGGDYGYDGPRNRSVAVDSRALLSGLARVYHADRLVSEINAARK